MRENVPNRFKTEKESETINSDGLSIFKIFLITFYYKQKIYGKWKWKKIYPCGNVKHLLKSKNNDISSYATWWFKALERWEIFPK